MVTNQFFQSVPRVDLSLKKTISRKKTCFPPSPQITDFQPRSPRQTLLFGARCHGKTASRGAE